MKTYHPTQKEVVRNWHLIDAKGEVLGRLASKVVGLLMGKGKANYSPHMDSGDHVVIINAKEIKVTGRKATQKLYRSHSGFPGGFKEISYAKMSEEHPERIIEFAIFGMLPENRIKKDRMARLTIVAGSNNPHKDKFEKKAEK